MEIPVENCVVGMLLTYLIHLLIFFGAISSNNQVLFVCCVSFNDITTCIVANQNCCIKIGYNVYM